MKRTIAIVAALLVAALFVAGPLSAQTPRDELVSLVPADSGFCLVVQGLRGQVEKWQRSPFVKVLRESVAGQAFLGSPEMQHLLRLEEELKRRLDIDWPTLRDDILGDAMVFAYRPPLPGNPEHEQGIVLVRARKPQLVVELLKRLNQEQKKSGELKELTALEHRGIKFERRVDSRTTHFVMVDGNLLVLAGKEALVRGVIDQRQSKSFEKNAILQQLNRAGAEQACAALWVNPRAFEAELEQRAQKDGDAEALMLRTFLAYWKPLDAIVLSFADVDTLEFKMALQARVKDLPASIKKSFTEPGQASQLWSRFPANAILTFADRVDLGSASESLGDFFTPANRKLVLETLQKSIGAALSLDLVKEVLPNVGPDWGFCATSAENPAHFPHLLAALAVKPGNGDVAVDQALFKGVNFLASLVVFDHNRKSDHPIKLKSVQQGTVEVRYLFGDKMFPAGFQPAWALKDGYLVVASTPEAVLRFQPRNPAPTSEVPIVRLSTTELARFVREHRQQVVDHFAEKNRLPKAVANQGLDTTLGLLDLVDHVTLSQLSGAGQMIWNLRVRTK